MIETKNFFLQLFEGMDKFDYKVINENWQRIDDALNALLNGGDSVVLPTMTIEKTENGYRITTQDVKGSQSFEIFNGKTAYQYALDGGYTGTEEEFTEEIALCGVVGEKIKQLSTYVTPQMFGAKGDGVTDDTEAIQNAINSSDYVYIPSGNYVISDSIIVSSPNAFYTEEGYKGKTVIGTASTKFIVTANVPAIRVMGYHNLIENIVLTFSNDIYSTYSAALLQLEALSQNDIKQCCNNVFNNIRCVTMTNVATISDKYSGVGIRLVSDDSNATYQNKFNNCNVADLYKGLVIEGSSTEGTNANYFHIDLWNCNYLFDGNGSGNVFTGNYQAGKKLKNEENTCFIVKGSQNIFSGYVHDTGKFDRTESQAPCLYVTGTNNIFDAPVLISNVGGKIEYNYFKTFKTAGYNDNKSVRNCRAVSYALGIEPLSIAPYMNSLQSSLVTNIVMETENVTLGSCEAAYTEKDANGIPTNIAPLVGNAVNKQLTLNVVDGSKIRLKFTMPNYSKLDSLFLYLNNRRMIPTQARLRSYKTEFNSTTYLEDVFTFENVRSDALMCLQFPSQFKNLQTYNYVELELSFGSAGMFGMSYMSAVIINDLYGPLLPTA